MKTVIVDNQNVVVIRERGTGDGWLNLRYMVEEADGTYSQVGEGYADPARAREVYDAPNDEHLRWIVGEARRQVLPPDERPPQEPRPVLSRLNR